MSIPKVHGAFDVPAVTDYKYEDVVRLGSGTVVLPDEHVNRYVDSYDQSKPNNPNTAYACTRYGTVHSINENNAIEGSGIVTDPVPERLIALNEYGAIIDKGDSLRSALIQARDRGLISGYVVCSSKYQMQTSLFSGNNLYTGTMQCNRTETKRTGIFTPGSGYGHAFAVVGYVKEGLIALNSYGGAYSYKGYTGCFLIKREHLQYLYTVYSLLDMKNIDDVKREKIRQDKISKERMKAMGIRNGLNEDETITRGETVLMIDRMYKNIMKQVNG